MTANTDGVFYQNARRYDAITRALSSAAPVEFYRTQLSQYGPSTLELACGTGRIALPLAEAGMDVSALDCSPEMLALAQSKARQAGVAVRWIEADMRRFTLGRQFDSVFVASNSLSHLPRRTDLQACFASVHSHLAPGGRFLVDVFNPALSILQRPPDERDFMAEYEDTEVQDRIAVSKSVRYAAATQILYETWYFGTREN